MAEDISVFTKSVLSQTDIVTLIQKYVSLKKSGSNYQGLCPFHSEKSPSFSVNPNKQFFYCFGCHASGDALNFVMKHENLTFLEALEKLASPLGLTLPPKDGQKVSIDRSIYKHMRDMTIACKHDLQKKGQAYRYLIGRGIGDDVIKKFHIGCCGPSYLSWFDQSKYQNKKQFIDFGIGSASRDNRLKPKFFKRLMFPIQDSTGKVIAFGARTLDGSMPKYLNSPETDIFKKRHTLYGLHQYKSLKSHTVYIVEGYMDVLALCSHGIQNAVACLGTAFGISHWNLLKRFASNVIFCLDGDKAGKVAAWKSLESILPVLDPSIKVSFLFLPDQDDPDSYIQANGKDSFIALAKNATSWINFLINTELTKHNINTLEGKACFLQNMRQSINQMTNHSLKEVLTSEIQAISKMPIKNTKKNQRKVVEKPNISKIEYHCSRVIGYLCGKNTNELGFLDTFDNLLHHESMNVINFWINTLKKRPQLTGNELVLSLQGSENYASILSIAQKETLSFSADALHLEMLSLKIELIDYMIKTHMPKGSINPTDDEKRVLQSLIVKKKSIEKLRHELQFSLF